VLESVLRNFDGTKITEDDVRAIANWQPNADRTKSLSRLARAAAGFTGVPLLVDLAAMRSAPWCG
jgi:aconitate hydratase